MGCLCDCVVLLADGHALLTDIQLPITLINLMARTPNEEHTICYYKKGDWDGLNGLGVLSSSTLYREYKEKNGEKA